MSTVEVTYTPPPQVDVLKTSTPAPEVDVSQSVPLLRQSIVWIRQPGINFDGVWPTRISVTPDPTQLVIWVGTTDPTRNTGYMLPGDIFFKYN